MNLKEKVALVYARKQNLSARTSWRTMVLFLALLIPAVAGQLGAAQDQPGANYALIIDVYSGAVQPDALNVCCRIATSILPDRVMRMDKKS